MPVDAPDFTLWSQTIEVVGTTPIPEQATTETPLSTLNDVTTISTSYVTVVTETIASDANGVLYGIELYASPINKARFRLTIAGSQKWTDKEIPLALNIHFGEARLEPGAVILLEVKSSDGTSIQAWGHIEGKEVA